MYMYLYMYLYHVHVHVTINFILLYILQLSDALCEIGFEGVDPLGNWWNTLRNKIDFNTKLSQVS